MVEFSINKTQKNVLFRLVMSLLVKRASIILSFVYVQLIYLCIRPID